MKSDLAFRRSLLTYPKKDAIEEQFRKLIKLRDAEALKRKLREQVKEKLREILAIVEQNEVTPIKCRRLLYNLGKCDRHIKLYRKKEKNGN